MPLRIFRLSRDSDLEIDYKCGRPTLGAIRALGTIFRSNTPFQVKIRAHRGRQGAMDAASIWLLFCARNGDLLPSALRDFDEWNYPSDKRWKERGVCQTACGRPLAREFHAF
jgi:hypothetical protein